MSKNNCDKYLPLPTVINDPNISRIIAIGDVHGDMKLIIKLLLSVDVIEKVVQAYDDTLSVIVDNQTIYYKWIGKKTCIVQIGDQIDSYRPNNIIKNDNADDINILKFFTDLHNLARKNSSCGVYSLLGNHELMNVNGNFNYVSPANINIFKNEEERKEAFARGKEYAIFLACTRHSVIVINNFLFIHGGIEREFLDNFRGRDKLTILNRIVQKWLLNNLDKYNSLNMKELLSSGSSPFWTRILGNSKQLPPNLPSTATECKDIVDPVLNYLDTYKIKGMVIGHTPQINDGINSTCDNKLWRIDVAASYAFDSETETETIKINKKREPQLLEIEFLPENMYKYTVKFSDKSIDEQYIHCSD